jgi:hypothetical protein
MPESYNGWTLNSVNDAPDNGTTAGCGTQEVTNLKAMVDKVGPPNGNRLAEIGTLASGRIVYIDDAGNYHVAGSTIFSQLEGGLFLNKTGEVYFSFGDGGYEKIWLTKEAATFDFLIAASGAGAATFRLKQSNGDIGIGNIALPAGVLHVLKDVTGVIQHGINKNVGPLGTGFTRDSVAGMVNLADSGVLADERFINFQFSGNYQGLIGHGSMHAYDSSNGASHFCHFSIRFSSEATTTITLDFGDISGGGQKFFITDSGTGIRLLILVSAGPNYNPVLSVQNNFGHSVDISYDFHLRKCIFA